jgi:hypothetical protein
MASGWGIGNSMNSLVIQIIMWDDGGSVRARLWSDAEGRSEQFVAASEQELVALVQQAVDAWKRRVEGRESS